MACSSSKSVSQADAGNQEEVSFVEEEEVYEEDLYPEVIFDDHVYQDKIKTVQLHKKDEELSFPVVFLGDQKQLSLSFDDLSNEFQTYSYEFIHCNANWQPSVLNPQEYLSGFMNGFIDDYSYSFNTLIKFIHFRLDFPNNETRFKLSGNYILKVYANSDREDLVLTRRFLVVDKRISIETHIHLATLARHRDYKQELDFNLHLDQYPVVDPFLDLKVVLLQNRRWDNAITSLKPLFVQTPKLVYNYEEGNLFDGNNEFRFFDAKDIRYSAMNVDGIQLIEKQYHLFVLANEPRSFKRYYSQQDLNGNRLIKRDNSSDVNREADYLVTHFNLKRETPVNQGDVYVYGALTDWQIKEEFKMKYVPINKEYTLSTPLKQGYYNYAYAVLPKGGSKADLSIIEGTHSETENDYYFLVYHRKNGEVYDRLVGYEKKNSFRSID